MTSEKFYGVYYVDEDKRKERLQYLWIKYHDAIKITRDLEVIPLHRMTRNHFKNTVKLYIRNNVPLRPFMYANFLDELRFRDMLILEKEFDSIYDHPSNRVARQAVFIWRSSYIKDAYSSKEEYKAATDGPPERYMFRWHSSNVLELENAFNEYDRYRHLEEWDF